MSDDEQTGSAPEPGVPAGRTHGHFTIIEPLGQGGMGIVYRAVDTQLDRTVALKFLPPLLSEDEEARRRFIAEARAASTLDHPNICTVHEIGETEDGQVFIAMALYEGETLDEKVAHGPLPLEEAIGYARQITQGLAKAHAAGIVHRDIKPANIIVTDDGIVKILDFGLAKLEDLQLTRSGHVLGTVKYMSPEHTGGDAVDQRTDLWSVGVLLYEMLAGRHPFGDGRVAQIMYGILNQDPEPLSEVNPRVPEPVERIVAGCLVKDPERRYQNALELLADLERTGFTPGMVTGPLAPMRPRFRVPGGKSARLALGAVTLAAFSLLVPQIRHLVLTPPTASARQIVAVLPFQTGTDVAGDEALATGLTYGITGMIVGLERLGETMRVIPASEVLSRGIETPAEARAIFGVDRVISGRLDRGPDGVRTLQLTLVQPDPLDQLGFQTLPDPTDDGFAAEARAALAAFFGAAGIDGAEEALAAAGPSAPAAYAYYLEGVGNLHRLDIPSNIENAIGLFERALEEDPTYALAHAGLCEARWEKYRETLDTLWVGRALASCDAGRESAQNQPEVLIALAQVYLETGQGDRALTTLGRVEELDPDRADLHRWKGRVYDADARDAEAEASYNEAIKSQPGSWINRNDFATFLAYRGRLVEAEAQYREIQRLTPDNYLAYNGLGFIALQQNRTDSAKVYFDRSNELRPNPIAYRNLGYLYNRENRYPEAIAALEKGIALQQSDMPAWRWMAHALYWSGERDRARDAWQRVIGFAQERLAVNPADQDALMAVAEAHVRLGDLDQARLDLDRALLRPDRWNYFHFYVARIHEALGNRTSAIDQLREAFEAGFDPVTADLDPWLEDLITDPSYVGLRGRFPNPRG